MSSPPQTGCTWASWNPGTSIRPARSTTSVAGADQSRTASPPTATIRPSFTATARARERTVFGGEDGTAR